MVKNKKKKPVQKLVTRQRVQAALMLALGLLLLNQTIQFYNMKDDLAFIDSLSDTNSDVLQDLSQSKEYLSSFGDDLNGIREFLLLPTKNYTFDDLGQEVQLSEEEEEENVTAQLFTYVEKLGTYEQNKERYDANLAAFNTAVGEAYWSEQGLTVSSTQGSDAMIFSFTDASLNGAELFSVELGYDGLFTVDSMDTSWEFDDREVAENTVKELKSLVDSDLEELREQLKTLEASRSSVTALLSAQSVKDALAKQNMSVSIELSSPNAYYYEFKNQDAERLAELSIAKGDGAITLSLIEPIGDYEKSMELGADAEAKLTDALNNGVDARSEGVKLVDQREKEMESVFDDRAFKAVLQEMELQMGVKSENDARISYPLLRVDGQTLRIIYIDKATGEVKVEMPDGKESQTLSMAIEAIDLTGKKKLSTPLWS
ncbi:MAG: hypothetical protein AAB383_02345 [Patescibacteria group bacterium]